MAIAVLGIDLGKNITITVTPPVSADHGHGRRSFEGFSEKPWRQVKEGTGNLTGDQKLKREGVFDQFKGKVQNAFGSIKEAIKGK